MCKCRWLVVMAASVLALGSVAAQSKSDFSGTWSIVRSRPGAPSIVRGGAFNCGPECTIVQDANTLTISRPADPNGVKPPDVVLNLDGRESTIVESLNPRRGEFTANAKWDGGKLVVTRSLGQLTITQILVLEDGKLTVANTFGIEGEVPVTLTYVKGRNSASPASGFWAIVLRCGPPCCLDDLSRPLYFLP